MGSIRQSSFLQRSWPMRSSFRRNKLMGKYFEEIRVKTQESMLVVWMIHSKFLTWARLKYS